MNFEIKGDAEKAEDKVDPILAATAAAQKAHPELNIEQFGERQHRQGRLEDVRGRPGKAETLSLPLTMVILLLAFGALVAAGLPAAARRHRRHGHRGPHRRHQPVLAGDGEPRSVVVLVGLAVGVDYSLFYIRREREERKAGRDPEAALAAGARRVAPCSSPASP